MRRTVSFTLAALAGLLLGSPARAVVLAPGQGSATYDSLAGLTGLTYVTSQSGTLDNLPEGGTINATYTEWIYKTATGSLDFFYQVHNLSGSDDLEQIAVSSFTGRTTDVGIYTGSVTALTPNGTSGGTAPNAGVGGYAVSRTANGSAIDYNFTGTNVGPNSYSAILYVATNATSYESGKITLQDDSSVFGKNLGPATPEPSSMVLVGLGAMGLIGYGLRRRKAMGA